MSKIATRNIWVKFSIKIQNVWYRLKFEATPQRGSSIILTFFRNMLKFKTVPSLSGNKHIAEEGGVYLDKCVSFVLYECHLGLTAVVVVQEFSCIL